MVREAELECPDHALVVSMREQDGTLIAGRELQVAPKHLRYSSVRMINRLAALEEGLDSVDHEVKAPAFRQSNSRQGESEQYA
jgi:hypothetical protein